MNAAAMNEWMLQQWETWCCCSNEQTCWRHQKMNAAGVTSNAPMSMLQQWANECCSNDQLNTTAMREKDAAGMRESVLQQWANERIDAGNECRHWLMSAAAMNEWMNAAVMRNVMLQQWEKMLQQWANNGIHAAGMIAAGVIMCQWANECWRSIEWMLQEWAK